MDMQSIQNFLSTTATELGIKILAAIAFWIIGRWLIGKRGRRHAGGDEPQPRRPDADQVPGLDRRGDAEHRAGARHPGLLRHPDHLFAALLAGAGVAIGVAWSGMLGNFAAGAFMLVLRPIKVGDFVGVGGIVGTVKEIGLFGTTIITPDNVMTIVGNSKVFGDTIQNFSTLPARRVERTAQLAGGVDAVDAIQRFKAAVAAIPNVVKTRRPKSTCSTSTSSAR